MSCNCENKKLGSEIDRIRRLAKALAKAEEKTVAIFLNNDGTYGFCCADIGIDKPIVEYITQY
ncbi:MAG: hypothetical protein LUD17_05260 [Bacteroidales bacterium]|nr:hypothetical protein [Bacteroidales bacterium]